MKTNANDLCHQNISQDMGGNFHHGLTKREYFAALAMQSCRARGSDYRTWEDLSKDAVEMADALIEELNKESK
jgi:hypothetical protein